MDFTIEESGLHITPEFPFLAASPDGILKCSCNGSAVIEIKCPFKHKDSTIMDAANCDGEFCLQYLESGGFELKKNHAYYFQVQMQMLVCGMKTCYFVVNTTVDIAILAIEYDEEFTDPLINYFKEFTLRVILPELLGKFFTFGRYVKEKEFLAAIEQSSKSTTNNEQEVVSVELLAAVEAIPSEDVHHKENETTNDLVESNDVILTVNPPHIGPCICKSVKEKEDQLIHCAEPTCEVRVFHRSCLVSKGKKRFNKNWCCDSCKSAQKKTAKRQPLKTVNK